LCDTVCPSRSLFVTFFVYLWRNSPTRSRADSFMRFLDHTQWHATVGRSPLDEGSAYRRDPLLHSAHHSEKTTMPPAGFEPPIAAIEWPQTYVLDRSATRICFFISYVHLPVSRDGVVGTATRYELDGPGTEYRSTRIFRTRPDRFWDPPNLLYNGYRVSFPGVKRPERGVNHPPPSSAEVKERVELHPLLPLWAFTACSRANLVHLPMGH
jgi:hypothetical protein